MTLRSVVRRISRAAMPSTPREYLTPRDGIQSRSSRKRNAADSRNPRANQSGSEAKNVSPATTVARALIAPVFSRGRKRIASAPAVGRRMRMESSPFIRRPYSSREDDVDADEGED